MSLARLACGLSQGYLIRARIDNGKQIALLNVLTFLEAHLHHLAIHTALQRNRVKRLHRAKAIQIHGQITPLRRGNSHGNSRVAIGIAVASASSGRGGGLRFVRAAPEEKAPG